MRQNTFQEGNQLALKRNAQIKSEYDAQSLAQLPNKKFKLDSRGCYKQYNYQQELQFDQSLDNIEKNSNSSNEKIDGGANENNSNRQNSQITAKNNITILGEILICNDSQPKLHAKLILNASKFMSKELLNLMSFFKHKWLIDAVKNLIPERDMSIEARAGILVLMTRLGESNQQTLEQIPVFIDGLDELTLKLVYDRYDEVLKNFYTSKQVRDWFIENVKVLQSRNLKAANYFDLIASENKNELMWISKICEVPSNESDSQFYIDNCERLFNNNRQNLIIESLKQSPTQQCMSLENFYHLTCQLCYLKNDLAIEKLKVELFQKPIIEWCAFIKNSFEKNPNLDQPTKSIEKNLNLLIREFGHVDKTQILKEYLNQDSLVQMLLKMCEQAPNDYQACVSAYQVSMLEHTTAQFWDFPGGKGKSRIIATTALICLLTHFKVVHIVMPTPAQIKREQEEFSDFWVNSNTVGQVKYHCDFEFEMQDDHILICDEADQLMFKYTQQFFDKASKHEIISMTASIPYSGKQSHESVIMEKMNMKLFSYSKYYNVETPQFDTVLEPMNNMSLTKYLQEVTETQAVLIYCNDDLADEICKVENSIRIDSETDYKMIRKLDHKMTPLGKYRLCFTTDGDTMRGFDYRAPNNGISLFLARSLQTERDFHQAMLRVGRFGDPKCKRIGFQNIQKVDQEKNNQLKASLVTFLSKQNPIRFGSVKRAFRKPNRNQQNSNRQNALLGQQKLEFKK